MSPRRTNGSSGTANGGRAAGGLRRFDLARKVCREASTECNDPTEKKAIASAHTVYAVVRLARADPRLEAEPDQWDRDPWRLNTPAGTINLQTGETYEHRREDRCTRITAVAPSPGCPKFMKFLDHIMSDKEEPIRNEMIRYLARIAGYALTGVTREQCLFFLHGAGSNGKSLLVGILGEALGDYAVTAPIEAFVSTKFDRHPTELARLNGPRLVTANEADENRQWNESRLKMVTGEDNVTAHFMRQDDFEFRPKFKLVIIGNRRPSFRAVNPAIRRRLQLIPFNVTIKEEEVDKSLREALREELPGILQWMIDGCKEWQEKGLRPPSTVREETESYLDQEDTFGQWVSARIQRVERAFTPTADLFDNWTEFAKDAGEQPGSQKSFAKEMTAHGFKPKRTNTSRGYLDVILKRDDIYEGCP